MAEREEAFAGYSALLAAARSRSPRSPRLVAIEARLVASGLDAAAELRRLRRLAELADARRSSVHVLLQAACAWDLHLLDRIGVWQRRAGPHVAGWLGAAGELEVLAAFAGVRHDEPGWAFAEIAEDADRLTAGALGHPLLAASARVANDVEIGPVGSPGRFLLVTGSNMSGKSTLLRAIGVNAILAQAGAPVCATAWRSPPLAVETSGRIDDSLAEGVSFFLAELSRLREIVDRASRPRGPGAPRVLFLLDELLRGTNSEERRTAVATVVARLLDEGAIGALSTHDLELATHPAIAGRFVAVHFRDELVESHAGPRLEFDYRLRDGLATTTNALVLLRLVGLGPRGTERSGAQPPASPEPA
jgi:DNA mismatch repair ATPase MutS